MDLALISVPYDLGREDVGSGRGPAAYLAAGAAETLHSHGHTVEVVTVRRDAPFTAELAAVLDVNVALAAAVAHAVTAGRLPLVLAGNCNVTLGVHAGLAAAAQPGAAVGAAPGAVVWLDAHGDFNTPEITETGYLDGMPLAMLTGRAYPHIWSRLGGVPQPEGLALHVGSRDLDAAEAEALASSGVIVVSGTMLREKGLRRALAPGLDALAARTRRGGASVAPHGRPLSQPRARTLPPVHLHIDIDALDPEIAPGVAFPAPGGLSLDDSLTALALVGERFALSALSLASLAPEHDRRDATVRAGLALLEAAVG